MHVRNSCRWSLRARTTAADILNSFLAGNPHVMAFLPYVRDSISYSTRMRLKRRWITYSCSVEKCGGRTLIRYTVNLHTCGAQRHRGRRRGLILRTLCHRGHSYHLTR